MQIDVSNVQISEEGNTYAELLSASEESPVAVAVTQHVKGDESAKIIGEYNEVYHSANLANTLHRDPTEEEKYADFIKWLEAIEYEGVNRIIVTQKVYDYFFNQTNSMADGYIDRTDGIDKYPRDEGNDSDYDPYHDDPDDCYSE